MMKADAMAELHFRKVERADLITSSSARTRSRPREYLIIPSTITSSSAETFDGRVSKKWRERAPRWSWQDDGSEAWSFEGKCTPTSHERRWRSSDRRLHLRPNDSHICAEARTTSTRAYARHGSRRRERIALCFHRACGFGGQRLQLESKDPDLA